LFWRPFHTFFPFFAHRLVSYAFPRAHLRRFVTRRLSPLFLATDRACRSPLCVRKPPRVSNLFSSRTTRSLQGYVFPVVSLNLSLASFLPSAPSMLSRFFYLESPAKLDLVSSCDIVSQNCPPLFKPFSPIFFWPFPKGLFFFFFFSVC